MNGIDHRRRQGYFFGLIPTNQIFLLPKACLPSRQMELPILKEPQNVVGGSELQKCGLKYVIRTRLKFVLTRCIENCEGSVREENRSFTDQFCHCPQELR